MSLSKNKLYVCLATACLAGYIWLFYMQQIITSEKQSNGVSVCLIKHVTNIPCPSCGSTRSMLSLLQGNFSDALFWNPIGIILFISMIILPIWLASDLITKKETLFTFYNKFEITLQRKWMAMPAILLMLANWIWNIYKGL